MSNHTSLRIMIDLAELLLLISAVDLLPAKAIGPNFSCYLTHS